MSIPSGPRTSASSLLRCRGCACTVTADTLTPSELADMLGWARDDDEDWCVDCQWKRGRTPRFVRRIAGH